MNHIILLASLLLATSNQLFSAGLHDTNDSQDDNFDSESVVEESLNEKNFDKSPLNSSKDLLNLTISGLQAAALNLKFKHPKGMTLGDARKTSADLGKLEGIIKSLKELVISIDAPNDLSDDAKKSSSMVNIIDNIESQFFRKATYTDDAIEALKVGCERIRMLRKIVLEIELSTL